MTFLSPLLSALIAVESGNRPDAVGDGGRALGILQIHAGVVADVNRLHGTAYTHADALDPIKARSIATLYLLHYATEKRLGRPVTAEDAARIWNGGPHGWRRASTLRYWRRVRPLFSRESTAIQRRAA